MLLRARRTTRPASIGGMVASTASRLGELGDRPRAVAFRQRRERRVELRTEAEMPSHMSQVDDLAAGRERSH